ncbi:hypothetical protein Dimus_001713 [Dionaea muscipula]
MLDNSLCYPLLCFHQSTLDAPANDLHLRPSLTSYFQVRVVRRDNSDKVDIPRADLVDQIGKILDKIQQNLFDVAKQKRDECIKVVKTWDEFAEALWQKKLILAPWCDEEVCKKSHIFC